MKSKKWLIPAIVVIAVFVIVVGLIINGTIILDRSGERLFENGLRWKGNEYVATGGKYHEGKTIAKTKDGFDINEVVGDDSHTFLVMRSFLDQWLVVREDYKIPASGKITKAYWSYQFIEDEKFLGAVEEMLTKVKPDFEYEPENDGIYQRTENQNMKDLYIGYEDCPIPAHYMGYMGVVDGKWCMTVGGDIRGKIYCYTIPEEYIPIFDEYLS